jgi:hypothetical protein
MSQEATQLILEPVDKLVRGGFIQRITQEFRAKAQFTTSPDQLATLKAEYGNNQPKYPYFFLVIQTISPNTDSYNPNRLARQGVPVRASVDGKQFQAAKLIPTNFDVEVTYVTPRFADDGAELDSVTGFVRRWLFARRNGAMNFGIDYGFTKLAICCTLSDFISIPKRDSPSEGESLYPVITNATIHGFMSEPSLQTRGRINEIVLGNHPIVPGQYFPF